MGSDASFGSRLRRLRRIVVESSSQNFYYIHPMKISELIEKLQEEMKQHGDVEVCCRDSSDGGYKGIDEINPQYPWKAGQPFVEDKEAGVIFISLE